MTNRNTHWGDIKNVTGRGAAITEDISDENTEQNRERDRVDPDMNLDIRDLLLDETD